jgi:hypothetical protein
MAKTLVSVVCTLVVCAPLSARAQPYESVGIRAQGMAGAFVAVADDATASWWNPAGLATSRSFADLVVLAEQGGNRGIALGFPSLGLSYYRLNISQIQPSNSIASGPSNRQDLGATGTGLPSLGTFELDQFGATMGQSIGGHLVVASTLKLVHVLSDTRADLDLGTMASFGAVRLGLTVRDVRSPTFGSGDGTFELASRARAGVAVIAPPRRWLDRLTVALDADLTKAPVDGRDERRVAGGAEGWVLGGRLGVRGGIGMNTVGERRSFTAFGVSAAPFPRVYVDGAVTRGPDEAQNRWGFGLRLTF